MKKQAFLIMYHNDYYILEKLLKQIDNPNFDIYLHIDKKVKNFDFEKTKKIVKKSNLYFTKRIKVYWSTYSQIQCELNILKEATKNNYSYYHLLSGVDLLLKPSNEIYNFFNEAKDKEFVAFQNIEKHEEEYIERIRYYHILNQNRRHQNKIIRVVSSKIYYKLVAIQKKLKINRLKNNIIEIKKGANWFSITNDLAKYVLTKEKEINRMYKFSNCADEVFLQTITHNSRFKDRIYHEFKDEHQNIKRYIDWNRGQPYTFKEADYQELINSNCFFARKFSSSIDRQIIDKIYQTYNKKESEYE